MAEEEKKTRVRRSRSVVLQEKLDKAKADRERYAQKVSELDETIKNIEEELNAQRVDEVMSVITEKGLSIDEAIEKLRS